MKMRETAEAIERSSKHAATVPSPLNGERVRVRGENGQGASPFKTTSRIPVRLSPDSEKPLVIEIESRAGILPAQRARQREQFVGFADGAGKMPALLWRVVERGTAALRDKSSATIAETIKPLASSYKSGGMPEEINQP
jgi:hypothetical protein